MLAVILIILACVYWSVYVIGYERGLARAQQIKAADDETLAEINKELSE